MHSANVAVLDFDKLRAELVGAAAGFGDGELGLGDTGTAGLGVVTGLFTGVGAGEYGYGPPLDSIVLGADAAEIVETGSSSACDLQRYHDSKGLMECTR